MHTDVSSISVKVQLPRSINHSSKVLPLVQLPFTLWKPLTYIQRYFQPKFVNLTQGAAKSPSETSAQAVNLSDFHRKGRLKPRKELLILQCLLRKTNPKTKQEYSYLLQHFSAIVWCTVAQANIAPLNKKGSAHMAVQNHTGKWKGIRTFWELNNFLLVCAIPSISKS